MADSYLNLDGAMRFARNVKSYVAQYAYDKAEVDNKLAEVESNIEWKPAVATYDDISATYPYPHLGWTVCCLDTNILWRYNGDEWVEVFNNITPLATTEVDGLMHKEHVTKIDNLGSAAYQDYTETVSHSGIPTAEAIQVYVTDEVETLERKTNKALAKKLDTEVLGDAGYKSYTENLDEISKQMLLYGDYYSSDPEDLYFVLNCLGYGNGVDFSYMEDMKNYQISFSQTDFKSAISIRIHVFGYKDEELINTYLADGDIISIYDIPDTYLSGEDSGELQIFVKNYDYESGDISAIETLFNAEIIDLSSYEKHQIVDVDSYEDADIEVHISEKESTIYTTYATYGDYSTQSLPTGTAVSSLVGGVKQELSDQIEQLAETIDDIHGADEADIDALFDL